MEKNKLELHTKEVQNIIYTYAPAEEGFQKTIFTAMNYSFQAGGKRLRPLLMPALDNDEYRRGRKTSHVVFGEAMAILAGDALLNYAFETACKAFELEPGNQTVARAFTILAKKAGVNGMIGGQVPSLAERMKNGQHRLRRQLLLSDWHSRSRTIFWIFWVTVQCLESLSAQMKKMVK